MVAYEFFPFLRLFVVFVVVAVVSENHSGKKCVCVCEREREREGGGGERVDSIKLIEAMTNKSGIELLY